MQAQPHLDPLVGGLTRPPMMLGIPYVLFVMEFVVVALIFINTKNLLMFLLVLPVHGIAYALTVRDNRFVDVLMVRFAEHVAGATHQSVNSTTPLLSAAMPHGERFQGVLSPAAPAGGAFSIRKQVVADLCLDDYLGFRAFDNVKVLGARAAHMADEWPDSELEVARLLRDHTPQGLRDALAHAVQNHVTMVISGGTSSGKTTFLNALLKEVPDTERVISIEDTRELQPPQPNWLSLLASKGDQGTSKVTIQDLLESSLRLRPDRLFLGEIRGAEAATFLQAVNTGHPGSLTTLHADSTYSAFDRLALMTLQSDLKLTKAEILEYVRSVVPMVVQLRRRPTRGVAEIYLRCYGQDQHK